jgi:hypothetical protein
VDRWVYSGGMGTDDGGGEREKRYKAVRVCPKH